MNNDRISKVINSIKTEDIEFRKLYEDAISFNYKEIPLEINEFKAKRLLVNCMRHKYSNYDKIRYKTHNRQYEHCKNTVLDQIAIKYPALEKECNKQKVDIIFVKKVV